MRGGRIRCRPHVRLLPLTLVVMMVVVFIRIGAIFEVWPPSPQRAAPVAVAQEAPADDEGPVAPSPPLVDAGAGGISTSSDPGADEFDPLAMTRSEMDLLRLLGERRGELEALARELDARERVIQAAEMRVDAKTDELLRLKEEIETLLGQRDEVEEQRLAQLVAIYEAMKPQEAAVILDDLEIEMLVDIIERMRERNSSPILARMAPDRARELTMRLAERTAATAALPDAAGN